MTAADHTNQIVTIKQFYSALNRFDVPAALKLFDSEVVRVEFEGTPGGGTCHGLQEMKSHIEKGRSTWAEGSCEPEGFAVVNDRVVVSVHVKVRQKDKTEWIDGSVTDVFTFRNEKIIEFRSFMANEDAMNWAENN
jgi:ketosteroid isomerase-like protein